MLQTRRVVFMVARERGSATIAMDAVIIASSYMPLATNNDFMVLAVGGSCVIGHVAKTVRLTDLDARELAKSRLSP